MEIVFFDASVLFKAAVTRFLLGAAQSGEYRAVWSDEVAEEARRNLQAANRPGALSALEQNLQLIRDPVVAPGRADIVSKLTATDAKDRHVLAAAAGARATVLVTDNDKDFDQNEAHRLGVLVSTPDQFVRVIVERNPHALLRHVELAPSERRVRYVQRLIEDLPSADGILRPLLED